MLVWGQLSGYIERYFFETSDVRSDFDYGLLSDNGVILVFMVVVIRVRVAVRTVAEMT